jgi:hypothetical protein
MVPAVAEFEWRIRVLAVRWRGRDECRKSGLLPCDRLGWLPYLRGRVSFCSTTRINLMFAKHIAGLISGLLTINGRKPSTAC